MDFYPQAGGIQIFPANIPLPFYMTYPGYSRREQEKEAVRDLEYLQTAYPDTVRQIQKKVAEVLDKVDYEGSMIYDEYPDKYSIMHLAESICSILERERADREPEAAETKALIQVLLSDEIYKRRHGGPKGFVRW